MWTAVIAAFKFVWGLVFPPKGDPTPVELAASNAAAQDQLSQEKSANAIDTQADAARITADVAVVHVLAEQSPGAVNPAANAAIAQQLPDAFN